MPGLPQLVVDDSNGAEQHRLDCIRAERTEILVEQWRASALVDRADWTAINDTLDTVNYRFRIERGDGSTFFEGRFADDPRDGNDVRVRIRSYEQDAIGAEPSGGRVNYQNVADSTVASDAISAVPTLSAGTVQMGSGSVSFSFANAEQSKIIRDAAEPAGQDVRYNNDRTVDFLDRLGSDKPSITIRSADQNIVNSLSVADNSLDPVTHIRGLGALQGPDQVSATSTIASYSAGDRKVYRKYENKDIKQSDRMQEIVDRLATEYDTNRRRLRVEAGLVPSLNIAIGDSITVDLSEHNIDRLLRIVKLKEIIGSKAKYIAELTNRAVERGGERKRRDDLKRFNSGDQGFIDRDNDSYGWQPVTSATNARRPYPYPSDVETEIKAEVLVNSIPYRAYSSGAASGGGSTSGSNSEFSEAVFTDGSSGTITGDGTYKTIDTFSTTTTTQSMNVGFSVEVSDTSSGFTVNNVRVRNQSTGDTYKGAIRFSYDSNGVDANATVVEVPVDVGTGDTYVAEIDTTNGIDYVGTATWQGVGDHTHSTPNHTHDPEPGLIEFGGETASNVDLIVNGNTVSTNIGSGQFNTTVDISNELTAGANTIEAASDSLGLVNLLVQTQLFRRGRQVP